MRKKNNVPVLRFPEFELNWEEKLFEEIYSFRSTNSLSRDKLNYNSGKIKNIHYGDIHKKFQTSFDITKEKVPFINKEIDLRKVPKENYCKEKDLVIADASEDYTDIGKSIELINLNNEKVLAGLHTFLARPDQSNLSSGFGGYIMQSWFVRKQIMTIAQGTKVLGISTKRLAKIKTIIPEENEQQKIANFLSAIDKKIQQLTQKKILLEEYKKGVMQNIFKQEMQFKDEKGKGFPQWEMKKLGELTTKTGKKNKENIKYPVYSINNKEGFLPQGDQFDGMDSNARGFDISNYKIIKENTFAYNPARINVGSIGFSGALNDVLVSSLYVCFQTKKALNDSYLLHYLNTYAFNKAVLRYAEGGVRIYLFYDNFSMIKIPLPSLEEQQKIVNFLDGIDEFIRKVNDGIEQMQEYKKGLLQKMFL